MTGCTLPAESLQRKRHASLRLDLWARNSASNISVRNGVVWAGLTQLVVGSASVMTVTVKPLHFVASKASAEGIYRGCVKADTVVDVAAAPGSNSRIDVVWVMQQDTAATTSPDGATQGVVGVTRQARLPHPQRETPSLLALSSLQRSRFPPWHQTLTLATIVQTAKWTAARGAPIPVANQADRDALTGYDGLTVWRHRPASHRTILKRQLGRWLG